MIQTFNNQHSDVEVVSKYVPDEDFKKQLALAIADGVMPAMAIVDSSDLLYFDSLEPLIDMSEIVDEDTYMDVAVEACRSEEGKIKGLPLGLNCLAFFIMRIYWRRLMLSRRKLWRNLLWPPRN